MYVYANSLQSHLNVLSKSAADFAMPADAFQSASNVTPDPASEAQTVRGSRGNAGECFQFDADSESPGADPEHSSFY